MTNLIRLDTLDAVHPAWRDRLVALMDQSGCYLQSVWRSEQLQSCWFVCAQNDCTGCPEGLGCQGAPGSCPSANPPGLSFHEYEEGGVPAALAADLGWQDDSQISAAHDAAHNVGCDFTILNKSGREPWHVQPVELADYATSPSRRYTPFGPLSDYQPVTAPDPWGALFVPILTTEGS